MNFDDIVNSLADSIFNRIADKIGVEFRAEAHRGMCAGSVNYCATPSETKSEYDVMQLVLAAYAQTGQTLRLDSPESCRHFFETFFEACKYFVRRNCRVELAGKLTYEARAYKSGTDAWMCPIAKDCDFNRLSTPILLDKSAPELRKARSAAKKKPFDRLAPEMKKVPQMTFVTCEACGHLNKIAAT